ncbi:MAG: putative periplasmic protein (DUF2233) [Bacteroidetes bacterium HLUCCA01]|nr:MAG: putative periplasmic protein (DUF2233) [Bacteroidetes bacterium HLUCCA01]
MSFKRIVSQVFAVLLLTSLSAAAIVTFGATDRLSDDELVRGVRYLSYELEGPFTLDIIEIDRTRADVNLVAWRSGGLLQTSLQMADARDQGRDVLAGINADFYSFQSTLPIGSQVTDGQWVYGVSSRRSHVLIDQEGGVHFDPVRFSGSVTIDETTRLSLTGVNRHRATDQAMFYNGYYGLDTSRSDSSGVELIVEPIGSVNWLAGNQVSMRVANRHDGYAGSGHPFVISVGPEHPDFEGYAALQTGTEITVSLGINEGAYTGITQVIGGGGRILREGSDATAENTETEGIGEAFLQNRHPRTFVAVSQDRGTIWLGTVDGRQAGSVGMNFPEMAAFLLELGAWDAVNLDGGGSTTMVVGEEIVNSPSDATGQRAVSNILIVEQL